MTYSAGGLIQAADYNAILNSNTPNFNGIWSLAQGQVDTVKLLLERYQPPLRLLHRLGILLSPKWHRLPRIKGQQSPH